MVCGPAQRCGRELRPLSCVPCCPYGFTLVGTGMGQDARSPVHRCGVCARFAITGTMSSPLHRSCRAHRGSLPGRPLGTAGLRLLVARNRGVTASDLIGDSVKQVGLVGAVDGCCRFMRRLMCITAHQPGSCLLGNPFTLIQPVAACTIFGVTQADSAVGWVDVVCQISHATQFPPACG